MLDSSLVSLCEPFPLLFWAPTDMHVWIKGKKWIHTSIMHNYEAQKHLFELLFLPCVQVKTYDFYFCGGHLWHISCWDSYFVFFPVTEPQCWELACVGVSHVNDNTQVLTWHSEQSSNWQRFSFLMTLSFQIFIFWVFCRLQRITHIHSSRICCAMGAFSLLFFFVHPSVHSGQQRGNAWLQNGETANSSAFRLRSPHVSHAS